MFSDDEKEMINNALNLLWLEQAKLAKTNYGDNSITLKYQNKAIDTMLKIEKLAEKIKGV